MSRKVLFYCDLNTEALEYNFYTRGWTDVSFEDPWNLYWSGLPMSHGMFGHRARTQLKDNQLVNHFPNNSQLSRKDLMVRNIRRYRRELEVQNDPIAEKDVNGKYIHLDFLPVTYILESERKILADEMEKNPSWVWILKPAEQAEGHGIYLLKYYTELPKALNVKNTEDKFVVCRYIENPLLIGGKKFDLRLYVLVTSYIPLIAYKYRQGFCRMCMTKYSPDELYNKFVHLTNVSVQKYSEAYNEEHGGKWPIENLRLFLESMRGQEVTDKLFSEIDDIIRHSLKAVSGVVSSDPHCFECYGYDIIISDDLKPWLIEVNSAPSLLSTTRRDRDLKTQLVRDILNICLENGQFPNANWNKKPDKSLLGDFEVLIEEEESEGKEKLQPDDSYNEELTQYYYKNENIQDYGENEVEVEAEEDESQQLPQYDWFNNEQSKEVKKKEGECLKLNDHNNEQLQEVKNKEKESEQLKQDFYNVQLPEIKKKEKEIEQLKQDFYNLQMVEEDDESYHSLEYTI